MDRHTRRAMVLACAMATASFGSRANIQSPTVYVGEPGCIYQDVCFAIEGSSALAFSQSLVGALQVVGIHATEASPGMLIADGGLAVSSPVMSLTSMYAPENELLTITKLGMQGGVTLTLPPQQPNGKKSSAMTGGSLTLTNLKVDFSTQGIYATVVGANGVGTRINQLIWNYGVIEGPTTFRYTSQDNVTLVNTLSRLEITNHAFDLFATSLGLTAFAKSSLAAVEDYGVITSAITLGVPEPANYLMMGVGFAGIALASRRRPATAPHCLAHDRSHSHQE